MKSIIRIHILTIPFFILIGFTDYKKYFFTLYFFIFLHELSHLAVSLFFNVGFSYIKLMPWGCMLSLEKLPAKKQSLIIHLAGPLFNLTMYFLNIFQDENLSLALFNLIPVMPFDGGVIVNLLFPRGAFFISAIFIILSFASCLYFKKIPFLPVVLTVLLLLGEKNRLDKTINYKICTFFNREK